MFTCTLGILKDLVSVSHKMWFHEPFNLINPNYNLSFALDAFPAVLCWWCLFHLLHINVHVFCPAKSENDFE